VHSRISNRRQDLAKHPSCSKLKPQRKQRRQTRRQNLRLEKHEGKRTSTISRWQKWVKAGRITHGTVFIGSPYEMSYSEYLYSDEGMKESKRMLNALTNRARDLNSGRPAITLDQVFQGGVQ
jgi:hypothetical protein